MTEATAQSMPEADQKRPLPESVPKAIPAGEAGVGQASPQKTFESAPLSAEALEKPEAPKHATGLAGFLHRHRNFTKEPVTYTAYQFFRSSIAAIPYGFAMAFGHHVFGLLSVKGQQWGLTEKGIDTVSKAGGTAAGVKAVDALANAELRAGREAVELYQQGTKALVGRNLMRVANSPLNAAVQIALGFTLFRFTGGVIKNLRDRVMNDKNTEADTANEVKHAGKTIWQTMKINWPAESTGTPIAALVLGFINGNVDQTEKYVLKEGESFKQGVNRVWSRPAKLLQNGGIWTVSYSLFFLMAESLFKDKQISRGLWKGHPNSLKNGADDIVGGPAAALFKSANAPTSMVAPGHALADKSKSDAADTMVISTSAEEGYQRTTIDTDEAKDSTHKLRFPFFTGEPSMGRFIIRRVLPVSVGITAYAALKRAGYLTVGGQMTPLVATAEGIQAGEKTVQGLGGHAKLFLKNTWKEGAATSMFGALWVATDAWGTFYDKFFHNLQKVENQVELNDNQQAHHAELLARLNEKEKQQGRAA